MEEICKAASAYYANLLPAQKETATKFFEEIDTDRDGKIGVTEFMEFAKNQGHEGIANNEGFFKALDRDKNGTLDFNEFVLVYYMHITRRMKFCSECKEFLKGIYFSCDQCFSESGDTTYDLCCVCFHDRNFKHHEDAVFVDNHLLLLSNRQRESDQQSVSAMRRSRRERMMGGLKTSVTFGAKLWGSNVKPGSKGNSNPGADQSSEAAASGNSVGQSAGTADSGSGGGGFRDSITECFPM